MTKLNNRGSGAIIGIFIIALVFVLFIFIGKLYHVSPGNVGVLVYKTGHETEKGVSDTPITPGFGFRKLFREMVVEYPVFLQNVVWTKSVEEGSKIDESITANTKEGLAINMDVSFAYTLESSKVPDLYVKFRSDIDSITAGYLRQTVRQAIQDTFGSYGVEEVYGEKKMEVVSTVKDLLTTRLAEDGFNIQQFTINEIRLPDTVKSSIDRKIQAAQDALKANEDLNRIKIEAEQRVAEAEAEARAIRLQSEAANNANYIKLRALEVQLEALKKWDGKLPASMIPGGSVPFVDVSAK